MDHSKEIIDLIKKIGFELTGGRIGNDNTYIKSEIYRYKRFTFEISYNGICANHIRYLLTKIPCKKGEHIISFYETTNCEHNLEIEKCEEKGIKEANSFILDFFNK